MRLNAMRKRSVAAVAALTVLIGLASATPALATYSASILFHPPQNATTFFSPFSGPAEITFNFDDNPTGGIDPPTTFNVRLRYENGATIHSQNFTITPQVGSSPDTVQFSWPAPQCHLEHELRGRRPQNQRHSAQGAALHPQAKAPQDHLDHARSLLPHDQRRLSGHDEDHVPAPGDLHRRQGPGPRGGHRRGMLRRRCPGLYAVPEPGGRHATATPGMAETTAE